MPERHFLAVRMRFKSPLHMGRGRMELAKSMRYPSSDGIKAAIYACALGLFPPEKVHAAVHDGLRVSAAFPASESGDLLPMPLSGINCHLPDPKEDYAFQKRLRKLPYIPKAAFELALQGLEIAPDTFQYKEKYLAEQIAQRVAVPPMGSGEDATPFHVAHTRFVEGAHLYFLVECRDGDAEKVLRASLKLMSDEGIGLGKSVGYGAFEVEFEENWSLEVPDESGHCCLLGNFLPTPAEWEQDCLEGGAWKLDSVGGFVASAASLSHRSMRRRSVYFFQPGSVLKGAALEGRAVDLCPEAMANAHPVWRDGRTIALPIHTRRNKK